MRFGPVDVASAAGGILAHSLKGPGFAFKKGRRLGTDDVAALAAAGRETVVVAVLEPDDVGEDAAAARVADAIAGDATDVAAPFTGRCNLFAAERGVAVIDAAALADLNAVDEAITVATVPAHAVVEERQMVATVKIIPFAVRRSTLDAAVGVAHEPLVRVAPLRPHRLGLVQTRLPGTKDSVLERTVATTRARLEALGSRLDAAAVVDHDADAVAAAVAAQRDQGLAPILVIGASAIVDREDVVPAAIVAAGGEVIHFGMPVDPGNLLLLARIGRVPVIGLPGCARSPKLNGVDWVLERLLAGLPVERADIMAMGVGGLLGEIEARPQRRAGAAGPARVPRIAAVVLAAGRSQRMPGRNKLLEPVGGRPMIAHAVDAALASTAEPVVVVVGHEAERVRAALAERPVTVVVNADYSAGLAGSVRTGIAAVPDEVDGAVFLLADTPRVGAEHVDRLIAAFDPAEGRAVCVPTHRGRRGNPVLWAARFFGELRALEGPGGARPLLRRHADAVCEVEMDDAVLADVDTPADLSAARAALDGGDEPGGY